MRVTFTILFGAILGLTTAKHLFDEENKRFETADDLSLARQEDIKHNDPQQMMRKKLFDSSVSLIIR